MGIGSYTTGISAGPSISQDDYQNALNRFGMVGQRALARPVAPEYGTFNGMPGNPAQTSLINQSRQLLGTDAGRQGAANFANTVNPAEAELAANQAKAQSQAGLGYQGALGDVYSGALSRGADLNKALADLAVRSQGLQYDLGGNLIGTQLGLAGQVVNPLISGVTGSIGNLFGLGGSPPQGNSGALSGVLSAISAPPPSAGNFSLGSFGGLGLGGFGGLGLSGTGLPSIGF